MAANNGSKITQKIGRAFFNSYFRSNKIEVPNPAGHKKKIYFSHIFTISHPYKTIPLVDRRFKMNLPVKWISHVTHNEEAHAIVKNYMFKPSPKWSRGKKYRWEGKPIGETYRSIGNEPTKVLTGIYFRDKTVQVLTGHTKKMYEVHFPNTFIASYPYETIPPKSFELPINRLSHVTHNEEAQAIRMTDQHNYIFKTAPKFGKKYSWDGSPMGETYRSIGDEPTDGARYMEVSSSNKVFPGLLSWWGISLGEWNSNDDNLEILRTNSENIPDYLKLPPQSNYGNNEFSGLLSHLLKCYKQSRDVFNAYLVIGGTLRYKHEICYVVIVCTQPDLAEDLKEFPRLNEHSCNGVLKLNGLVDDEGKVTNASAIPILKLKHVSTTNSWESLAFAFYFRSDQDVLVCDRHAIKKQQITHNVSRCTSKKPPPEGGKWKCPNDLYARRVQRHGSPY